MFARRLDEIILYTTFVSHESGPFFLAAKLRQLSAATSRHPQHKLHAFWIPLIPLETDGHRADKMGLFGRTPQTHGRRRIPNSGRYNPATVQNTHCTNCCHRRRRRCWLLASFAPFSHRLCRRPQRVRCFATPTSWQSVDASARTKMSELCGRRTKIAAKHRRTRITHKSNEAQFG